MKYFLDTEFVEGFNKPLLGKNRHFIDLISIGIIAEDGREYYAISNEVDVDMIWNMKDDFVLNKVVKPMFSQYVKDDWARYKYMPGYTGIDGNFTKSNLKSFFKREGKASKIIAQEIVAFINPNIQSLIDTFTRHDSWQEVYYPKEFEYIRKHNTKIPDSYWKSGGDGYVKNRSLIYNQPEIYAYYADYDWVLFCSLFGRMIDLPKGFPMYCRDLKQMLDEKCLLQANKYPDMSRLEAWLHDIKNNPDYPRQQHEHNSLDDAKWNSELHSFISNIEKHLVDYNNRPQIPAKNK